MQKALDNALAQLADALGPLSPFAKAVVPAALALAVAVVNSAFSGKVDGTSLTIAVSGVVLAVVTYLVPNRAHTPAVAAAPAAAAVAAK